jgi:hypothetical protein
VFRFVAAAVLSDWLATDHCGYSKTIKNQVAEVSKRRIPYEDFWQILATESSSEKSRSWDTGNWWAMYKLNNLDKEPSRQGYFSSAKAIKIANIAGTSCL